MFLAAIAQKDMHEAFLGFSETAKDFSAGVFSGRLGPTDRFLSIYNQPTRMRQVFLPPDTVLPESGVFRHAPTEDIYLVGVVRLDSLWDVTDGEPYVALMTAHLCTPSVEGGSGLAQLRRRSPMGPASDPGWLVDSLVAESYIDTQLLNVTKERDLYDWKTPNYTAWMAQHIKPQQWDTIVLDGVTYRVQDAYSDLGMTGMRIDLSADPRVDLVVNKVERVYNPATYDYETTKTPYNVTAKLEDSEDTAAWGNPSKTLELSIQFGHIGFAPEPDMEVVYAGVTRRIKQVTTPPGEQQYRVTCGE